MDGWISVMLTLTLALGSVQAVTKADWIAVARCRAHCFDKFVSPPSKDSKCASEPVCYECWRMCEDLHFNVDARTPLCDVIRPQLPCTKGCRSACDFVSLNDGNFPPSPQGLTFPDKPALDLRHANSMGLSWQSPMSKDGVRVPEVLRIIYVLLWRSDMTSNWRKALMTSDTVAHVRGPHGEYDGLELLLLAVTMEGVVAEYTILYPEDDTYLTNSDLKPFRKPARTDNSAAVEENAPPGGHEESHEIPGFSVTVQEKHGHLQAQIYLEYKPEYPPELVLLWRRETCQLRASLPHCNLPSETLATTLIGQTNGTSHIINHLTYNSRYWLELRYIDDVTSGRKLLFVTPECANVDETFMHCLDTRALKQSSVPPPRQKGHHTNNDGLTSTQIKGSARGIPSVGLYIVVCAVLAFSVAMVTVCCVDAKRSSALCKRRGRRHLHDRIGNGSGQRKICIENLDIGMPLTNPLEMKIALDRTNLDDVILLPPAVDSDVTDDNGVMLQHKLPYTI